MSKKVIDVSAWNGTVDWSKCKDNGVKGVIIKIIRKDLAQDQQFTKNYKGCHKYKIPWGVYNYSYATTVTKAKSDMTLICNKLDKLAVDGIWGSKTQNALYAYWTQLGWRRGSYAGEKTCRALWKDRKKNTSSESKME